MISAEDLFSIRNSQIINTLPSEGLKKSVPVFSVTLRRVTSILLYVTLSPMPNTVLLGLVEPVLIEFVLLSELSTNDGSSLPDVRTIMMAMIAMNMIATVAQPTPFGVFLFPQLGQVVAFLSISFSQVLQSFLLFFAPQEGHFFALGVYLVSAIYACNSFVHIFSSFILLIYPN